MGVKEETSLQERMQKYIEARGGYVNKNWGNMISKPGVADLTVCYRGLYLALEVKVDDNEPTKAQGIHARKVNKANGISAVVWSVEQVKTILDTIDACFDKTFSGLSIPNVISQLKFAMSMQAIDDGTRY